MTMPEGPACRLQGWKGQKSSVREGKRQTIELTPSNWIWARSDHGGWAIDEGLMSQHACRLGGPVVQVYKGWLAQT
eukprot:CAMPEP_0194764522 /NCGR_PEP_ID=MMETSP0323_2-20130528/23241_1 /TAXON_ID=2866 ORGANISM="Crypthecodinium cohnii, Strain Seligo" /NCGR_SAMPLE_ID=MMETSP0323_2 /ASSEMBLY_ACC=CAM_ASM_000346 /LENGTH=75 /DNA_ID=CAMNT_0039691911 /DNA_START=152 /DNA_END=379 /DNA_ORIENTATION=-